MDRTPLGVDNFSKLIIFVFLWAAIQLSNLQLFLPVGNYSHGINFKDLFSHN